MLLAPNVAMPIRTEHGSNAAVDLTSHTPASDWSLDIGTRCQKPKVASVRQRVTAHVATGDTRRVDWGSTTIQNWMFFGTLIGAMWRKGSSSEMRGNYCRSRGTILEDGTPGTTIVLCQLFSISSTSPFPRMCTTISWSPWTLGSAFHVAR